MNQITLSNPSLLDPANAVQSIFDSQQRAVRVNGAPSYPQRIEALKKLELMVKNNRQRFLETISLDFGNRSFSETELGELMPILNSIKYVRAHLKGWMRPQKRKVGMAFKPASAKVVYQPLGVIGIMAPWNYPLTLTLVPLIEALAAGNRAIIKPAELTPHTAELLKELISAIFPEDQVAVVTGGPKVAAHLSTLPFDHLLFTGSTHIGRQVMAAAAVNLTPVTLELGGKSPVVYCRDYSLEKAARIIAIGKLFNAGQTCVAPDYVLVPDDLVDTFAAALQEAANALYPSISANPDYTSIISQRHFERLDDMIEQAVFTGAKVWQPNDDNAKQARKIPPTILTNVSLTSTVMREEIFGPILPVIGYATLDDAIKLINDRPKPLALYCFAHDKTSIEHVLDRTRSGGVTINGTMLHATQEDLPFGGVGESGTGAYHGFDGFVQMSHARGVFKLSRFNMSHRIAAPYGKLTRLITRLMLGK
ncbi:aldehyde dehydrogenase [Pseudomonas sp. 2822-15]|uniref:Aldehyde dehydrogenase n=1 Tax=Pseudomonas salomonii TaxID=191391 RepID=A0A7Y8KNV2_9PSED|nr:MULTISPECIES: coniferyl aldehyde dehydrogenase [Pseudomonas]NWF09354.1 coniferyl aldehyde dehydrogenase [Pseudomonas salomonii]PIB42019.1 aldehyde dehydrogenase [Pseudomonas sp. 2822-15]